MRAIEKFQSIQGGAMGFDQTIIHEDTAYGIKGEVWITLNSVASLQVFHIDNLVVRDASILIARLMKNNAEVPHGVFCLAVGTGASGWDLQNPPSPTATQRSLYGELARKTFSSTNFVDSVGAPSTIPTNVVDFNCTFTESEAVGPIVEMALLGGNVNTNLSIKHPVLPANGTYNPTVDLTQYDTEVNYLTFPVVNKPATSTLSITWRLTF